MKNITYLFIPILFIFSSCKKLDKLTQFNMEFNQEITVPATLGVDIPLNINTPPVESNSENSFSNNNTSSKLVSEIKLSCLDLTLSSPASGDFGFLESIEIYINADGLDEKKIAWKDNIPSDIDGTLSLDTSDDNLKEFIVAEEFTLRINAVTDEVLATDHEIDVRSVFFVDATILGFD